MKRLIVNADGYGFTPGVNAGIEEVLAAGVVKSISCTPNFGYLEGLKSLQVAHPCVSIGVHVNLSVGRPVSDPSSVPSLVTGEGVFWGAELLRRILSGHVKQDDILRELRAQVGLLHDMGIAISHIDGHQNRHLYPHYFQGVLCAASEFGIRGIRSHRRILWVSSGPLSRAGLVRYYAVHPVRAFSHTAARARMIQARRAGMVLADGLITPGYADTSHKSQQAFWMQMGRALPEGTWEVYCHPAYVDSVLRENAKYVEPRDAERRILGDLALRQQFEDSGVELISFKELM